MHVLLHLSQFPAILIFYFPSSSTLSCMHQRLVLATASRGVWRVNPYDVKPKSQVYLFSSLPPRFSTLPPPHILLEFHEHPTLIVFPLHQRSYGQ